MPAGLFVAIALLAQAPVAAAEAADAMPAASASGTYGPALPAPAKPPKPKPPVKPAEGPAVAAADRCVSAPPSADTREIVVCVQRPQGYRLDPDVVEANRAKRSGRPKRPERMRDNSCASVGPMGCGPPAGVDLLAAAMTAAQMAARLAKGQEIGSMFKTTPEPTEYQLYVEAKRRREAKEAEAAAMLKAKARAAEQAEAAQAEPSSTARPSPPQP